MTVLDVVERTEFADFETAIHYAKNGKFQKVLLAVCGVIYATCAISTTTLSFVLPSSQCDFKLSSADKGKLSAMPLIGMIFGCGLWGYIANSQGRKVAILLSLLIDFLAALTSAFAQTLPIFLLCRFFNGFGIIGATSIVFSYLGEFAAKTQRDSMLGKLEVFWNVGMILLPGLAWILLRGNLQEYFGGYDFSPWRIFVLVCSLPSLISLVLLYFLPETPKFLISKGQYEKAKFVFRQVYAFNTGESPFTYPITTLEGERENNNQLEERGKNSISAKFREFFKNTGRIFTQPYFKYICITCFADFGLMASYFTLIMWFPEIFDRYEAFEKIHPNISAGVCSLSTISQKQTDLYLIPCDSTIENRVFIDTILIGLSCIPTSCTLGYFMRKLGKKNVLILGFMSSGLVTVALTWVTNAKETLALSCVFEALTSILEAVIFCIIVDLFPTDLRAFALAATATSGRLGAIFGNVVFGLLIDIKCNIPIYLFGSLLIGSGLLSVAVPKSDHYLVIH